MRVDLGFDRWFVGLLALAMLAGSVCMADATPISYSFEGLLLEDVGTTPAGTTFSGMLNYDSTVSPTSVSSDTAYYDPPAATLWLTVGSDILPPTAASMSVTNNAPGDYWSFSTSSALTVGGWLVFANLTLEGLGDVFPSTSPPPAGLLLSDFGLGSIFFDVTGPPDHAGEGRFGTITAFGPTPVPDDVSSGLLSLFAGMALVIVRLRLGGPRSNEHSA